MASCAMTPWSRLGSAEQDQPLAASEFFRLVSGVPATAGNGLWRGEGDGKGVRPVIAGEVQYAGTRSCAPPRVG